MALSDDDIARIMVSIPEPVSDSGNDVAVWATNLCIAIEAETRKQDDALIRQLVEALENSHATLWEEDDDPSRPAHAAITAGRARLESKP